MKQFTASSLRNAAPSLLRTTSATFIAASLAACVAPSSESDALDPQAGLATENVGTTEQAIGANSCAHPQCVTGTALKPHLRPGGRDGLQQ